MMLGDSTIPVDGDGEDVAQCPGIISCPGTGLRLICCDIVASLSLKSEGKLQRPSKGLDGTHGTDVLRIIIGGRWCHH